MEQNLPSKWVKISLDRETYERLVKRSEKSFRSVPGEIRYLTERAEQEERDTVVGCDCHGRSL